MAKENTAAAQATPDLFKRRPGRPSKGDQAKTNAQRQAEYRKTHKPLMVGPDIGKTIARYARDFDLTEAEITRKLLAFALCNRAWDKTGF